MNDNSVLVAMVLDRSGSMGIIRDATIEGVNGFFDAQRKTEKDVLVYMAQFDHEYSLIHDFTPIKHVPPLDRYTFSPRGSTALMDAIGRTIDQVGARLAAMPEATRPSKVVVVIQTDGEENSSREYSMAAINERITRQTKEYNWEFIFLGANQDAIATASQYGIAARSALTYSATNGGVYATYNLISSTVTGSCTNKAPVSFSDTDRKAVLDTDSQEK